VTKDECADQVNRRLREYFENRKKWSCLRDRLSVLKSTIDQALNNPLYDGLDDYLASTDSGVSRDIAAMRQIAQEQETISSFLKEHGIDGLP
jgi:hypothetical protein